MGPLTPIRTALRKVMTLRGRGARSEYWVVCFAILTLYGGGLLALFLTAGPFWAIDPMTWVGPAAALTVVALLALRPIGWQRMHDLGRPGWHSLIPAAALIVSMVMGAAAQFLAVLYFYNPVDGPPIIRDAVVMVAAALFAVAALVTIAASGRFLFWLTRPGQPHTNAHGPNPQQEIAA